RQEQDRTQRQPPRQAPRHSGAGAARPARPTAVQIPRRGGRPASRHLGRGERLYPRGHGRGVHRQGFPHLGWHGVRRPRPARRRGPDLGGRRQTQGHDLHQGCGGSAGQYADRLPLVLRPPCGRHPVRTGTAGAKPAEVRSGLFRDRPDQAAGGLNQAAPLHLKAGLEVLVGHLVGDQRGQIQTGLQQAQHLAPGGEHLTPIDALDGQGLQDDRAPVRLHRLGRNAQHGHAAAHDQGVDALFEGDGRARHLQRHVEADLQAQLVHDVAQVFLGGVHRAHARRNLLRKFQAEVVDIGQDHGASARMAGHGGGHHADRAGASDQHVLAQQVELLRRVHGVAERVQDRADLIGHVVRQFDDVERRGHHIFGERALTVHADAARVRVQMKVTGAGRFGVQVDDVPLGRDALADLQAAIHVLADGDDLAREFMAGDHRHGHVLLGPLVPVPDVDVGAADGGAVHLDQHVLVARDGDGGVDQLQPFGRFRLGQGLHGVGHGGCSRCSASAARPPWRR
uniref:NAD-specific glutamate dehydrogenase n=1 Tax=Parastrongyloides trichosuri TaxID=131310 RepID=A0A0N5A4M9_PARTI